MRYVTEKYEHATDGADVWLVLDAADTQLRPEGRIVQFYSETIYGDQARTRAEQQAFRMSQRAARECFECEERFRATDARAEVAVGRVSVLVHADCVKGRSRSRRSAT